MRTREGEPEHGGKRQKGTRHSPDANRDNREDIFRGMEGLERAGWLVKQMGEMEWRLERETEREGEVEESKSRRGGARKSLD